MRSVASSLLAAVLVPGLALAQAARPPRKPAARPKPTAAPTPVPPPGADTLTGEASKLCDAAVADGAKGQGRPQGKVLILSRPEGGSWAPRQLSLLDAWTARLAADVKAVVCIEESLRGVGRKYTDGQDALATWWRVGVVRIADGRLVGSREFSGYPPSEKQGFGPGIGGAPVEEMARWLSPALDSRAILAGHGIEGLVVSPDGEKVAVTGHRDALVVFDLGTGEPVLTLPHAPAGFAFSPDGRLVASGGHDATVKVWEAANSTERHTFSGHAGWVRPLMFSPDGRTLVSHSGDGLRFWDVASGKPLKKWGPKGNVNDVAFAPDGRALVVGQYQTVTVWDMARRSLSRTMKGESSAIAVSSDGRLVAGAAGDTVHLWNLQTGASLWTQPARHVRNIAFSPDGRVLAAATWLGEKVLAWDADTGQAVATIDDPGKPLTVAFAKDGLLLSGDEDGVIRAWDLRSRTASATSAPAQ